MASTSRTLARWRGSCVASSGHWPRTAAKASCSKPSCRCSSARPELEWEIRGREILPFARDGATTSDVDTSTTSPFPSVAHEAISHTGRGATGDAALDDLAGQQSAGTALVLPAGDEQWRHDVEGWWHRPLKIQGNAIRIWLPVPDENVPDDVYDAETEYLALIGVDRINAE